MCERPNDDLLAAAKALAKTSFWRHASQGRPRTGKLREPVDDMRLVMGQNASDGELGRSA